MPLRPQSRRSRRSRKFCSDGSSVDGSERLPNLTGRSSLGTRADEQRHPVTAFHCSLCSQTQYMQCYLCLGGLRCSFRTHRLSPSTAHSDRVLTGSVGIESNRRLPSSLGEAARTSMQISGFQDPTICSRESCKGLDIWSEPDSEPAPSQQPCAEPNPRDDESTQTHFCS